jgi:hypothetical protein
MIRSFVFRRRDQAAGTSPPSQKSEAPAKKFVLGALYGEGRDLLLARLRTANAIQAEELRKLQIQNDKLAAETAIELAVKLEKIKNPESREAVRALLVSNTSAINRRISGFLPAPENKKVDKDESRQDSRR